MSKSAESGMDRQQGQAEAERLLYALVTVLDAERVDIRGHRHRTPGRWDAGAECQACRAWRQARDYARAITAGLATVPTLTRCRGCESYRRYDGSGEYCNQDGLPLRADGESCSEYQPETHQDAAQRA